MLFFCSSIRKASQGKDWRCPLISVYSPSLAGACWWNEMLREIAPHSPLVWSRDPMHFTARMQRTFPSPSQRSFQKASTFPPINCYEGSKQGNPDVASEPYHHAFSLFVFFTSMIMNIVVCVAHFTYNVCHCNIQRLSLSALWPLFRQSPNVGNWYYITRKEGKSIEM